MKSDLKFFWNGIKAKGRKLQRCTYHEGQLIYFPVGTITVYAQDYAPFSNEIRSVFKIENNSEAMTDYFETDTIRVVPTHPLYRMVKMASDARAEHYAQLRARRYERLEKRAA